MDAGVLEYMLADFVSLGTPKVSALAPELTQSVQTILPLLCFCRSQTKEDMLVKVCPEAEKVTI